jgi:hypothetical protein
MDGKEKGERERGGKERESEREREKERVAEVRVRARARACQQDPAGSAAVDDLSLSLSPSLSQRLAHH